MSPDDWVSDRVAELTEQLAGVRPDAVEPWLAVVILDVVGGIHALVDCGLVSADLAARALDRLAPHYQESTEVLGVSVQRSPDEEAVGHIYLVEDPDQPVPGRPPDPPPPTLRRVLAVGEVAGLWRGEPVTILSVELWSDAALVNVVVQVADPEASERLLGLPHPAFGPDGLVRCDWRASDDLGTSYRVAPSGGTGTASWWRTSYAITPSPVDAAGQLVFEAVDDDGRVTARAQIPLS